MTLLRFGQSVKAILVSLGCWVLMMSVSASAERETDAPRLKHEDGHEHCRKQPRTVSVCVVRSKPPKHGDEWKRTKQRCNCDGEYSHEFELLSVAAHLPCDDANDEYQHTDCVECLNPEWWGGIAHGVKRPNIYVTFKTDALLGIINER